MSDGARRLLAFYQHLPPTPSAAALRGQATLAGLAAVAPSSLRVYAVTATAHADAIAGCEIRSLGVADADNASGLARRVWRELRMGWVAARAMTTRHREGDALLVSTPSYLAALLICGFARRRGIRYALDVRDLYPQAYEQAGLIRRDGRLYRYFSARTSEMYAGAARVITATVGLATAVSAAAPRVPVHCVYNGLPARLLERHAAKHGRFTACFHGVLGYFQDVSTLMAVAAALAPHEIDVVVVGHGKRATELVACRLPNLRFLGRLSFEDTMAAVERCHVGLCLRRDDEISRDAFPVKVWECLGLGMPSIVTPPCEAGEFLERERCGTQLPAGDVDAIVAAVLALARDRAALHSAQVRCRAVAAHYTRERLGRKAADYIVQAVSA